MVALIAASCTSTEKSSGSGLEIVHNRWKKVSGIKFYGRVILPMEYDSIERVHCEYADFIAHKDGKAELWKFDLDVPEMNYYWKDKDKVVSQGTPKMTKLTESPYMYELDVPYAKHLIVLVDDNGKKSVYGYKDPYAPYDEIYPSVDGYITRKNGKHGYCGVAPVYEKVYICKMQLHYYYLTSVDGTNCDLTFYPYGEKKVRRNVITIADAEEFRDLDAKYVVSEYSFSEYKDHDIGAYFYDCRLAGGDSYWHKAAIKKLARRHGN